MQTAKSVDSNAKLDWTTTMLQTPNQCGFPCCDLGPKSREMKHMRQYEIYVVRLLVYVKRKDEIIHCAIRREVIRHRDSVSIYNISPKSLL